ESQVGRGRARGAPRSRRVRGPGGPGDRYRDIPRRFQRVRTRTQHGLRDPAGRPRDLPPWRSGARAHGGGSREARRRGHRARAHFRRRRQPDRREGGGGHSPARAEGRGADVLRPRCQEGHPRTVRPAPPRARREGVDAGSQTVGDSQFAARERAGGRSRLASALREEIMGTLRYRPEIGLLLQIAMLIFVVTVLIGIANGTKAFGTLDRNVLLTHVHAGTLGWITLGVAAACLWIFGGTAPRAANEGFARGLVIALAGSIPLYVIGFWSGSFVARAALSTPVFVAIIALLG